MSLFGSGSGSGFSIFYFFVCVCGGRGKKGKVHREKKRVRGVRPLRLRG